MASLNNVTNNDLKIYKKFLDLIAYTTNLLTKFPRSEKFALSSDIRKNLYTGLGHLIRAIKLYNKHDKLEQLFDFDVTLSVLKVQIRLANQRHYLTQKNYTVWSENVTEICNMLGGWISSCQRR